MAKRKGKGQGPAMRLNESTQYAKYLASGNSFSGSGTTPREARVISAKAKIDELTSSGYRINPNTATEYTRQRMGVSGAGGKLRKLLSGKWR